MPTAEARQSILLKLSSVPASPACETQFYETLEPSLAMLARTRKKREKSFGTQANLPRRIETFHAAKERVLVQRRIIWSTHGCFANFRSTPINSTVSARVCDGEWKNIHANSVFFWRVNSVMYNTAHGEQRRNTTESKRAGRRKTRARKIQSNASRLIEICQIPTVVFV